MQEGWAALADSFIDKIYELSLDHWAGSAEIAKLEMLLSLKEREAQMNKLKNDYSLENVLVAVVEKLQRSNNEKDDKIAKLSRELDLLRKSTPVEDNTKGNNNSSKRKRVKVRKRGQGLEYQPRELQTWSPRKKRSQVTTKGTPNVVSSSGQQQFKRKRGQGLEYQLRELQTWTQVTTKGTPGVVSSSGQQQFK